MGINTELKEVSSFLYRAELLNGLIEHEFDYIFVGRYEESPEVNPEEVEEYKWISLPDLLEDVKAYPDVYTYWIKVILQQHQFLI